MIYNDKLSPSGSTVGQTTPLVYVQKRNPSPRLQELAISAFGHNYNNSMDNSVSCGESECNGLSSDLNPQWEFQTSIEATNYTIMNDWAAGRDYLIDDFTILGFRPQDEITTEL